MFFFVKKNTKEIYFCSIFAIKMEISNVPIFTLSQIIDLQNVNLINREILAYTFDSDEVSEIKLNYPIKLMSFMWLIIVDGKTTVSIEFQEMRLKKMDVVFLYPGTVLEFKEVTSDFCFKEVLISVDYISEVNLQVNSQEAFEVFSNSYSRLISLHQSCYDTIVYGVNRLQFLNNPVNYTIFSKEMLKNTFSLIIYELANFVQSQQKSEKQKSMRKEDIAIRFVGLVSLHFRVRKDVQFYADLIFISRTHLTRTIKEVFGKAPKQIIEGKIIAEAKILLLKKELSIIQVMNDLNFEDQPIFTKFFKRAVGVTPNAYRKNMLE